VSFPACAACGVRFGRRHRRSISTLAAGVGVREIICAPCNRWALRLARRFYRLAP
jgi:hypothetical protein